MTHQTEQLNEQLNLDGRLVEVRLDKGKPARRETKPAPKAKAAATTPEPFVKPSTERLIIQNLPEGTSWKDLKELFSPFGPVSRSDVQEGPSGGLIGFITLLKSNSLEAINELNGHQYNGVVLNIAIDDGAIPVLVPPPTGFSIYVGNVSLFFIYNSFHFKFAGKISRTYSAMALHQSVQMS